MSDSGLSFKVLNITFDVNQFQCFVDVVFCPIGFELRGLEIYPSKNGFFVSVPSHFHPNSYDDRKCFCFGLQNGLDVMENLESHLKNSFGDIIDPIMKMILDVSDSNSEISNSKTPRLRLKSKVIAR